MAAKTRGKIVGPPLGRSMRQFCTWSTQFDGKTLPASFLHEGHSIMNKSNTVKLTLDLNIPPALTSEQKARLTALAALPDEQIDTSDAPFRPDAAWMKAADQLPHTKQQITLRIDAEVLEFFKDTGKRYQSRINAVLRSYVDAHKAHVK